MFYFFLFSLTALCVKCESVCVHVCACNSIFKLQAQRLTALFCSSVSHRLHTWKLVYVRAHARASVPLFQRWKQCASACERKLMCADLYYLFIFCVSVMLLVLCAKRK